MITPVRRMLAGTAAMLLLPALLAAGELRIACNGRLAGWMRESSPDSALAHIIRVKREALDYYRALGFTHVLYPMENPYAPVFNRSKGGWEYNRGDYAMGDHAESLAAMKREVESRGMELIPAVQSLSHVESQTRLDPSISEFDARNPKPPPPWLWSGDVKKAYLAYDGAAAPGRLGDNPGADQFFREYMRIIRAVWEKPGGTSAGKPDGKGAGKVAHPSFIVIGHDELGYSPVSFIKAGKSRRRPETAAELVAMEIDARFSQVRDFVDPAVEILLYGDSFVPGDYGQTYGLIGDPATGSGGVLDLLNGRFGWRGRFTVIPWIYSSLEADGMDDNRKLRISKKRQLAYLDRLGVPFIVGTGEDGMMPYDPPLERTKECLFEWVREARRFPARSRGYANFSFNNFDTCRMPKDTALPLCAGYSAALLAYLAWNGGSASAAAPSASAGNAERAYHPDVFTGVDFRRSRWERKWRRGVHFR